VHIGAFGMTIFTNHTIRYMISVHIGAFGMIALLTTQHHPAL
jgi:hypothetical protein